MMQLIYLVFIFGQLVHTAFGAEYTANKLMAQDQDFEHIFGKAVGISFSTVAVGAPEDDDMGNNAGAVYMFTESILGQNDWEEVQKLTASDGANQDYFGYAISIDEDNMAIGAYGDDQQGTGAGSAYVFHRTEGVWDQAAKLLPHLGVEDAQFAVAVSLSGTNVVCSSKGSGNDQDGNNYDLAYLFSESSLGAGDWAESGVLALQQEGAFKHLLGDSVGISMSSVVLGAPYDDKWGTDFGSAYIFAESAPGAGDWFEAAKFIAYDGKALDQFGSDVDIWGQHAIVGNHLDDPLGYNSGSAYIYSESSIGAMDWEFINKLKPSDGNDEDYFGQMVAINEKHAIVGSFMADDWIQYVGAAFVFAPEDASQWNSTWGEKMKIVAYDQMGFQFFGGAVAVSGETVVIGADNDDTYDSASGAAYIAYLDGNDCESAPCFNGGFCFDAYHTFKCNCTGTGADGDQCETLFTDHCGSSPCANDFPCIVTNSTFYCDCLGTMYTGPICEDIISGCASGPCLNGGVCTPPADALDHFDCDCTDTGYEGQKCEDEVIYSLTSDDGGSNGTNGTSGGVDGTTTNGNSTYNATYTSSGFSTDAGIWTSSGYSDVVTIIYTFDDFAGGVSEEEYLAALPAVLADEIGGTPDEYSIKVSPYTDGNTKSSGYMVTIVYANSAGATPTEIETSAQNSDAIDDTMDRPRLQNVAYTQPRPEDQEEEIITEDDAFGDMIWIVIGIAVVFACLVPYFFLKNEKKKNKISPSGGPKGADIVDVEGKMYRASMVLSAINKLKRGDEPKKKKKKKKVVTPPSSDSSSESDAFVLIVEASESSSEEERTKKGKKKKKKKTKKGKKERFSSFDV